MGIKKIILQILLSIVNFIVRFYKIDNQKITFVSLESTVLESDLKLIYDQLKKNPKYHISQVLIHYDKKNLINNFRYMLNTIKQLWHINRSKLVIISDNNYVISNFKREGVTVIQVWHATGAIKKFGNVIKREYPIANYDYVIANSEYWKEPYSQAFNVLPKQVQVLGMPRVDHLFNSEYLTNTKKQLLDKYPILQGKKIILYAPTFRGNIYKGFTGVPIDGAAITRQLGKEYILIYKLHPLLKDDKIITSESVICMNEEDTHDLFTISDMLISDFSSIIFDYAILNKPMFFYVPDIEEYLTDIGCFVDYEQQMPGAICHNEQELVEQINIAKEYNIENFRNQFFTHQDGQNTKRIVAWIERFMG